VVPPCKDLPSKRFRCNLLQGEWGRITWMLIANSLAQGSGAQHPMITLVPADPAEMQVNKKGDL
jgi:hypothetical protein